MRSQLRQILLMCALIGGVLVGIPSAASAEKVVICSGVTKAAVAACDQSDWADHMDNSYWSMYAGHNCTNYVAYRESLNGVPTPTIHLHNANQWATNAAKLGYTVNTTPAKGAAGVFGTYNHVVYIDGIGDGYLLISEDNYPGYWPKGMYRRLKVYPGDSLYPKYFIHFEAKAGTVVDTTPIKDGDFVSYKGASYRMVGGAPLYVSDWSVFGGRQTTRALIASQWSALSQRPADGTFLRTTSGQVYRVAGGAPLYVSNWAAVGGKRTGLVTVDAADVDKAGGSGVWNHLLSVPADGTYIRTLAGRNFRIAGGAPIFVSDFAAVGGKPSTGIATMDVAAISNAGGSGQWSHLSATPADGTLLEGGESGDVYRVAGGAPLYVSSLSRLGSGLSPIIVDDSTIDAAGGIGKLGNLRDLPANGTIVRAEPSNRVYVVAGGAPVRVSSWASIGGQKPAVTIDQSAVTNAGSTVTQYSHLRAMVTDTFLRGGRSGRIVRVNDQGYAWRIRSWAAYGGEQPTTTVDDTAINSCDRMDCSPFGEFEQAQPARARFTVTGWAQDPSVSGSIPVEVLVDGVRKATVVASATRADVDELYHRGSQFGYDATVGATAGTHQICITAVNSGAGEDASLGCKTIDVLAKLTPTVTLSAAASSKKGAATVTATIAADGIDSPDGRVTVRWGDEVLARSVAVVDGTVTIPVSGLPTGRRALTVTYSGNADIDSAVATVRVRVK